MNYEFSKLLLSIKKRPRETIIALLLVVIVVIIFFFLIEKNKNASYYDALGDSADNRHDLNGAENYYKKAIELNPNLADAYMGLGGIYYEKGDYGLELLNYRKATILDTKNSDDFYYLATALEDNGNYKEAITTFEKALKLKPDNKDALHDLGILYLTQGDESKAENLVSRLILLDQGWGDELKMLIDKMK